jgi:hypothetical protein
MKSADLIDRLSRDVACVAPGVVRRRLLVALSAGAAASLAIVVLWLPLLPLKAMSAGGFWVKLGLAGLLALSAGLNLSALAAPGRASGQRPWLTASILAAMLLLGAAQLLGTPPAGRLQLWLGRTSQVCSPWIVGLSLPIYLALVVALRRLAPTRLAMAGGFAGLTSGAVAAALYALHCPEQAPAFIATWYGLGVLGAGAIGALSGRWLLRW